MADQITMFDDPPHLALERLAAKALADDDHESAFRFADRRCRITPPPVVSSYLLRAEASFRLGQTEYAIADLAAALIISPDDIWANRKMLAWANGREQQAAALSLLSSERNMGVVRKALETVERGRAAFAAVRVYDQSIEGWAVWDRDGPIEVSMTTSDNAVTYFIEPDAAHPLADKRRRAARLELRRPRSDQPQSLAISRAGQEFFRLRMAGNEPLPYYQQATPRRAHGANTSATIIVPIYADYAATRACIDSLIEAVKSQLRCRVLLVDDASPDQAIKRHLATLSKHVGFQVLTNPGNLGFVGSINRALSEVDSGDVILLNSDTVVPAGFVERLAAVAHSAADIGTVTPMSNNGEFSSFPIPNQSNDWNSLEDAALVDSIAAAANRDRVVDIPSGVGFCLYVTRTCLDAIGPLSERYRRGYLEDADFCLRAREKGFRNVCAPAVFVYHAGSRSFKGEKRSLVIRNLDVLDAQFPNYRNECAAYLAADPLLSFRENIERNLPAPDSRPRLIVSGDAEISEIARRRGATLQSRKTPAMRLEIGWRATGMVASPTGLDGAIPQNLHFRIDEARELKSLRSYLKDLQPRCVEIWDPARIPPPLLDILLEDASAYELFVADAGIIAPHLLSPNELLRIRRDLPARRPAEASERSRFEWRRRWRDIAAAAEAVTGPSAMAAAFAGHYLDGVDVKAAREPQNAKMLRVRKRRPRSAPRLAILPLRRSVRELATIRALARALQASLPKTSIVVLGETADDAALMQRGECFVTGRVEPDDIDRTLRQYAVDYLMVGVGLPLFGHPLEEATVRSDLPVARLDWSFGRCRGRSADLLIDPALTAPDIAEALVGWMRRA